MATVVGHYRMETELHTNLEQQCNNNSLKFGWMNAG